MRLALVVALLLSVPAAADPVIADPPRDAAHPAGMTYVGIPSRGVKMNGVIYTAAGTGPHPTLLLLHGFPGNEQNLDLAQAVRRAGFNVLTFHYRGAWGSPGAFSFGNAIEDSGVALAFLRSPDNIAKFNIDPNRIFVAGHSMGGFMAMSAGGGVPYTAGVIMISAWDLGVEGARLRDPANRPKFASDIAEDVIPLAGTSAVKLMAELTLNAIAFDFLGYAAPLHTKPVLLITAADGSYEDSHSFAEKLRALKDSDVTEIRMDTDHSYSDHRIALAETVVSWLQRHLK